jgi:MFS family permease
MKRRRFSPLWRHPDFLKLWTGQTVSLLGDHISLLALPLIAVLTLQAGPAQMGLLAAAGRVPLLAIGLVAGVWVDRARRRPILIGTNLGHALLLGSVPAAWAIGVLSMPYLYAVAFLGGTLNVLFSVAYMSYLPSLVPREHLVEGNSKLTATSSMAQIAGPGIAGGLVQLLTAPIAVLLDAVSFLVSAFFFGLIQSPEPVARDAPAAGGRLRNVWRGVGEGLRFVAGNPLLRAAAGCASTFNFFLTLMSAVLVLYLARDLGLEPASIGLIFAALGPGLLLGALLAGQAARRFGLGRTISVGLALAGTMNLAIPLAGGPPAVAVAILMAAYFLNGVGQPLYNIGVMSVRQAVTPARMQGRMNATNQFLVSGPAPLAALLGGLLGEVIGLRATVLVGAAGILLALPWVFASPLRALREPPASHEEEAELMTG